MLSRTKEFFPFSPSFLRDVDMEGTERVEDESDEEVPINEPSQPDDEEPQIPADSFSSVNITDGQNEDQLILTVEVARGLKYLVGVMRSTPIHLSGFGQITLLCGNASIHGYSMQVNTPFQFRVPVWQPTLRIFCPEMSSKSSAPIKVDGVNNQILKKLRSECTAVFLIDGKSKDSQEWLEAVEDQTLFQPSGLSKGTLSEERCVRFTSGCIGTAMALHNILQLSHLPSSWSKQAEKLLDHNGTTKVMVCGSKGVGKSTFARYIANRLLSERSSPVYYLNCDLGQPEGSIPGFLALHRLTSPLLSASHFDLDPNPVMSFFLADLTSRREPDLFLSALRRVMEYFTSLCSRETGPVHLLVNTDGYVRYMGAEVLNAIFNAVQPSHILHLRNIRHHHMPFHTDGEAFSFLYESVEEGRSVPSRVRAIDLRTLRLASYFLRNHPLLASATNGSASKSEKAMTLSQSAGKAVASRKDVLDDVQIKSAVLVGGERGSLAMALLAIAPVLLPLDLIVFNPLVQAQDLPSHLLLAVANLALVSYSILSADDELLADKAYSTEILADDESGHEVTVYTAARQSLRPSHGLALVRAVDVASAALVLTLPFSNRLLEVSNGQRVLLTISSAIHLPQILLIGAIFPAFPYHYAESVGEGAAPLRTRPNKKRKALTMNAGH